MEVNFYSRQAYPKPIDKQGEFSSSPYSITLPNNGYLDDINTFFEKYDSNTMTYAIDSNPAYPILDPVTELVVESSMNAYKLAGLLELDENEIIVNNDVVFTDEYQTQLDSEELAAAKLAKIKSAKLYKDECKLTNLISITFDNIVYQHGISDEDATNINNTITTLDKVKSAKGIDVEVPWLFKNNQTAILSNVELGELMFVVQQAIMTLFTSVSVVIAEISELDTIDEVNEYDIKAKF